jgi:hypothetical protein
MATITLQYVDKNNSIKQILEGLIPADIFNILLNP